MKRAIWLALAVLPLAGQPKLLTNAKLETRSAAAGLENTFQPLLTAQPQPAWIGYTVPAARPNHLGCDSVSGDWRATPGMVHLEAPDQALILFRIESNAVDRIRAFAPDCAIDAGGVPVYWLTDVQPAQSIALLTRLTGDRDGYAGAVSAIAWHADPAASAALRRFLDANQPQWLRLRAVSAIGSTGQPDSAALLAGLAQNDPDTQVRRRAISALRFLPGGGGIPLLIQMVKTTKDADVRKQAMSSLGQSHDPRALAFFEDVLKH